MRNDPTFSENKLLTEMFVKLISCNEPIRNAVRKTGRGSLPGVFMFYMYVLPWCYGAGGAVIRDCDWQSQVREFKPHHWRAKEFVCS